MNKLSLILILVASSLLNGCDEATLQLRNQPGKPALVTEVQRSSQGALISLTVRYPDSITQQINNPAGIKEPKTDTNNNLTGLPDPMTEAQVGFNSPITIYYEENGNTAFTINTNR